MPNPALRRRQRQRTDGLTIVEVLIVLATIGILAVMFVPSISKRYARSARVNCAYNLKLIGLAAKTWALDNGDKFPVGVPTNAGGTMEWTSTSFLSPHFQVMSNELSTPKLIVCPTDDKRAAVANFSVLKDENISYFLNLDATEDGSAGVLSGDGNLTNPVMKSTRTVRVPAGDTLGWSADVHQHQGTLLFTDGSVGQFTNGHMPALTNSLRLAVPPPPCEKP